MFACRCDLCALSECLLIGGQYLPEELRGMRFLDDLDLGTRVDPDLEGEDYF